MLKSQRFHPRFKQGGVTLLEVLVTVAILSVGLLGMAGLLTKSTALGISAHDRTVSTQKIYAFADRMRANPEGVNAGYYNNLSGAPGGHPGCTTSPCSAAQIAQLDFFQWRQALAASLPGGQGTVAAVPGSEGLFTITVRWQGKGLDLRGLSEQTYSMSVRP
ncbi:MAG: type IV pilus modification protein PilV [Proteobacteria bacterium]|nr:type IV pilus modification protein PilV [Pseudomonadota bacterium]